MPAFNDDRFIWLERATNERGGATIDEIAKAFSVPRRTAITWVCRWENYYNEPRDIVQHFIEKVEDWGPVTKYKIGPDWWGERYNKGQGEAWHDTLDVEGINSLHVSLGFMKTRTDSVTHKRTLKGVRKTGAYLKWIEGNNGATTAEFADKFGMTSRSASTCLSRWKKGGMLVSKNGKWLLQDQQPKELEVVLGAVGEVSTAGTRRVRNEWQAVEKERSIGE